MKIKIESDVFDITNRIKDGAKLMGLKFIDHIIIGDNYYSFHEHGYLS